MDRPIHHQMAASGLEADKIISRRGGRRSRPPRRRASSAGRRHPTQPGLPPNSHRTERSGHFGTDGQSSRISKYSAGRMWLLGTSGCAWRVTWRDRRGRLTVGFHLLGPRLAQPPGLSQTLEVPDDLHDPVRCPRPGSVRELDLLVPAAPAALIPGPPRGHRVLSRATSKPAAKPRPPSRGGSAPSLGSTGTPLRKNSSAIPRPRTSAGLAWTTSRTPPGWTVTSSARCRSPPGLDRLRSAH